MTDPAPAIFFDDGQGMLAPLRDLRPISEVRTGALTSRERLCAALGLRAVALFVQPPHETIAAEATGLPINTVPDHDGPALLINGRCPLPLDALDALERLEVERWLEYISHQNLSANAESITNEPCYSKAGHRELSLENDEAHAKILVSYE